METYTKSQIVRRCGQLSINFEDLEKSPYWKFKGIEPPKTRIQYMDGVNGTVGWGKNKKLIEERDVTPHTYKAMLKLLELSDKSV